MKKLPHLIRRSPLIWSLFIVKDETSNPIRLISTQKITDCDNKPRSLGNGEKRLFRVMKTSKKEENKIPLAKQWEKIGTVRAMREYCLTEQDLKQVPRQKRRSAYQGEAPDIVHLVSDVYARALEVHGNERELSQARRNSGVSRSERVTSRISDTYLSKFHSRERQSIADEGLKGGAGKVIRFAIAMNLMDCCFKFVAWFFTGSHSLFAEAVHSAMDTVNQLVLATGIHYSAQKPTEIYPYGFGNLRYVSSLITGCGIFCFGCGLSVYHGIHGLLVTPVSLEPLTYAYYVLGLSLFFQSMSLYRAFKESRHKALVNQMTIRNYIISFRDPSLNVVLLEDVAGVTGVCFALCAVTLSTYLQTSVPDALGSILIGGLLGSVALFIIRSNTTHLVGRSLPKNVTDEITTHLINDHVISGVHDIKATLIGPDKQRYKAEIDFNGRNIASLYLDGQNLDQLLKEAKSLETTAELSAFIKDHGGKIIDKLGDEVDRLENDIKKNHPNIRHVDLEAL